MTSSYFGENDPQIHVVGVGGGGVTAVNHMRTQGLSSESLRLMAVDTDNPSLIQATAGIRVRLGDHLVQGHGTAGKPTLGRQAAEDSTDELYEVLRLADVTCVVCGLGGGTGTGAAPVVARIARAQGALVIGLVTRPHTFEGVVRTQVADAGLAALRLEVDALLVIPSDRLLPTVDTRVSLQQAYALADESITDAVRAIADLLSIDALITLDVDDLRTILAEGDIARMGVGRASGEDRARRAAHAAVHSLLLEGQLVRARSVLFSVTGDPELKLFEVNEMAAIIKESAHTDVNLIFGVQVDKRMGDAVRVTILAAGFDGDDAITDSISAGSW